MSELENEDLLRTIFLCVLQEESDTFVLKLSLSDSVCLFCCSIRNISRALCTRHLTGKNSNFSKISCTEKYGFDLFRRLFSSKRIKLGVCNRKNKGQPEHLQLQSLQQNSDCEQQNQHWPQMSLPSAYHQPTHSLLWIPWYDNVDQKIWYFPSYLRNIIKHEILMRLRFWVENVIYIYIYSDLNYSQMGAWTRAQRHRVGSFHLSACFPDQLHLNP